MSKLTNEAVAFCSSLIRIDTTNSGDPATTVGEHAAAELVAAKLAEVGLTAELVTPEPGRTSVVVRIAGSEPDLSALLVHGHLDVVPAVASEWTVPPFSGAISQGCVWGRGAVDMKGFLAMVLAVARRWQRDGVQPRRDIVLAFVADEENGGDLGAGWLCRERPDLLAGCTEAIGEVGGFCVPLGPAHSLYPIMTAEKGLSWAKVTATGSSGHGSLVHPTTAIGELASIITRLESHEFALHDGPVIRRFLEITGGVIGLDLATLPLADALASLGHLATLVEPGLRSTVTPTVLQAGTSINTAARSATAFFDCRTLPGLADDFERELATVVGEAGQVEWVRRGVAVDAPFDAPLVAHMGESLRRHDPTAVTVPYMVSAGTDAKSFATLGIACYGFSPLKLPVGTNFGMLFHGVDERIPVAALGFGAAVLDDFLLTAG